MRTRAAAAGVERRANGSRAIAAPLLAALFLSWPAAFAQSQPGNAADPLPRIRPSGPRAAYTLSRGLELCPTMRALVADLQASDLIVYIAIRPRTSGPAASIAFVSASPVTRFLRVTLRYDLTTPQMISLLGHELQHALEVAREPRIRDRKAFDEHYRCNGLGKIDPNTFDTHEALIIGERVRQELADAGVVR